MTGARLSNDLEDRIKQAATKMSKRKVAELFNRGTGTVYRLTAAPLPRPPSSPSTQLKCSSGCLSKPSRRDKAHAQRLLLGNRRFIMHQIPLLLSEISINISNSSLQRFMRRLGLHRCVAVVKPFLNDRGRILRRQYAILHACDIARDAWARTIFVDEVSVNCGGLRRLLVTRRSHEMFLPEYLAPRFQRHASVMFWGAIWLGGQSKFIAFDLTESGKGDESQPPSTGIRPPKASSTTAGRV